VLVTRGNDSNRSVYTTEEVWGQKDGLAAFSGRGVKEGVASSRKKQKAKGPSRVFRWQQKLLKGSQEESRLFRGEKKMTFTGVTTIVVEGLRERRRREFAECCPYV